jgi:hypothetical protein
MAEKENKGGVLTNEQVERDLEVKGRPAKSDRNYVGSQDIGDDKPRDSQTSRDHGENSDKNS